MAQEKKRETVLANDRLVKLLENKNINDIAKAAGIDPSTLRRIKLGDRGTSSDVIANLARQLNTTTSYLLNETNCEKIYFIPGIDEKTEQYPIAEKYIEDYIAQYGKTLRYYIYEGGEAMSPRYAERDILVYARYRKLRNREGTEENKIINGDIAIVNYRGKILVRGYFEEPDGSIILKAINPSYRDIKISLDDDFEIYGKIIFRIPPIQKETGFF